jgi:hypothetical protein
MEGSAAGEQSGSQPAGSQQLFTCQLGDPLLGLMASPQKSNSWGLDGATLQELLDGSSGDLSAPRKHVLQSNDLPEPGAKQPRSAQVRKRRGPTWAEQLVQQTRGSAV